MSFAHVGAVSESIEHRLDIRVIATRLTQRNRRDVKNAAMPPIDLPSPEHTCSSCGVEITRRQKLCQKCWKQHTVAEFSTGRRLAHSPSAIEKRSETMLHQRNKIRDWKPSDLPAWLTRDVYVTKILPLLASITKSRIRAALNVSEPYSSYIQQGKRIPHPRHWLTLARTVGECR